MDRPTVDLYDRRGLEWAATHAAAIANPQRQRAGLRPACAIAQLRRLLRESIHRRRNKVRKLNLRHRLQTRQSRTNRR